MSSVVGPTSASKIKAESGEQRSVEAVGPTRFVAILQRVARSVSGEVFLHSERARIASSTPMAHVCMSPTQCHTTVFRQSGIWEIYTAPMWDRNMEDQEVNCPKEHAL
jgi:hypothetical protein